MARWVFAGCILVGPALAVPYVARLSIRLAAEQAYSDRRWEDADRLFLRYHELHGRETDGIRFHWALSLMNLQQWRSAEEVLSATPPGRQTPPPMRVLMGICFYYEGRSEQAERNLRVSTDPDQIYLCDYFLGRLAERRGDVDGAIAWYKSSLGRSPTFYPSIYQIVRLLLFRGETDLARRVVQRFLTGEGGQVRGRLASALIDAVSGSGPPPPAKEFLIVQR